MIIKFSSPISIEKARQSYRDNVKFISTTADYPNVYAIEFDGEDVSKVLNQKQVGPKVNKKANKIINRYQKKITRLWSGAFKNIKDVLSVLYKSEKFIVSEEQKQQVKNIVDGLYNDFQSSSEKYYEDAYKIGQLRGQIIANQEIDDDGITDDDQDTIDDYSKDNEDYLINFKSDVQGELDRLMLGEYDTADELIDQVDQEIETPKKSRALMYGTAILGLVVAGTMKELSDIASQFGSDSVPSGGIWTLHPDEGKGGEVCLGCIENSGKFFTLKEFENEYHTNDCLTNCRCDLDMKNG